MYLIALTNYDYIWITLYFSIFCIVAYYYRRKNSSSFKLLHSSSFARFLASSSFGLIEIILAAMAGSYFGLQAIYVVVLVLGITTYLEGKLNTVYSLAEVETLSEYVEKKYSRFSGLGVTIVLSAVIISCICLVMALVFKTIHSLMGWNFGNSVLGLFIVSVMAVIIGGRSAVITNKLLQYGIILFTISFGVILAVYQMHGLNGLSEALTNLAIKQKLSANYYTGFDFGAQSFMFGIAAFIGLGGFYLLRFKRPVDGYTYAKGFTCKFAYRVIVAVLLMVTGVIAVATVKGDLIAGKQIVTIEAQLPDGQMGYIVKAVDKKEADTVISPGLIPPLLNPETNLVMSGQYDYVLAVIVMLRHYLPAKMMILIFLMLVAGFIAALMDYLLDLAQVILNSICRPYQLFAKYGEIGELWVVRIAVFSISVVCLLLTHFMLPYFDLLTYSLWLSAVLFPPLLAVLTFVLIPVRIARINLALVTGIGYASLAIFALSKIGLVNSCVFSAVSSFVLTSAFLVLAGWIADEQKK